MRGVYRELGIYLAVGMVAAGGAVLVVQNKDLRTQAAELARRAVEPRVGLYVPEVPLRTLSDTEVALGALDRPQVVFFFNTTCQFCRASVPAWLEIAETLSSVATVDLLGVGLDSADAVRAYAEEESLPFPVAAAPDPRLVGLYRVSSVPLTLVIHNGRMSYVRLGPLESRPAVDSVLTAVLAVDREVGGL